MTSWCLASLLIAYVEAEWYVFTFATYQLFNFFLLLEFAAQIPGTTQDHLQIFNIEAKTKIKSHQMPEQVQNLKFCQSMRNHFV